MGHAASSSSDDPILARAGRGNEPKPAPDEEASEPPRPKLALVPPPASAGVVPTRPEAAEPPAPEATVEPSVPPEPATPLEPALPLESEAAEPMAAEPVPPSPPAPEEKEPPPDLGLELDPPATLKAPSRDNEPLIQNLADTPQGMMEHEAPSTFTRPFVLQNRAGEAVTPPARRPLPDEHVGKEAPLELPRREPPRPPVAEKPPAEHAPADEPAEAPAPSPPAADSAKLDDGVPWATPKPLTIRPRAGSPAAPSRPAPPARMAQIIPHPASARSAASGPDEAKDDEDPLAGWTPQYVNLEDEGLPQKPAEPLAQQLVRALRENRAAQLAAGGLLLIVVALVAFQPWAGAPGATLGEIKRNPSRYSDRAVRVRGRVGEVFPMGNGFTFYLIQGRDTMAVYTRSRTPLEGQRVEIIGTVQPGVLDGETRLALFEQVR